MSKLERITVTMPAEMAAKLRAAVERGEYATTSEVVREALRDWSDEQERADRGNAAIRAMLDSARAGGRCSRRCVITWPRSQAKKWPGAAREFCLHS